MTKKSNDEKFVMNFFQNITQNFSESDYIPEEDGRFCDNEVLVEPTEIEKQLDEIEKELDKDEKRLISEKIDKKLTRKGYSSKKVGPFTFYIKTREEYIEILRKTLKFTQYLAESAAKDHKDYEQEFLTSMAVLFLSDLLEKVEAEDEKDKEQKND